VKVAGLVLTLLATNALAATAYVTDELVLGVYATPNTQGQRLATLHSGAVVETLSASGDATEVRLADGTTGWVKTAYLTNVEPATTRIKQMQDELDRTHATTPALAEAAERSEVERLTRELTAAKASAADAAAQTQTSNGVSAPAVPPKRTQPHLWQWLGGVCAAVVAGFWLGYATLARRIKRKFGGIKVY
jgi:SH3 domain protein